MLHECAELSKHPQDGGLQLSSTCFAVSSNAIADASIRTEFSSNPFHASVSISLWADGDSLVRAKGTNPGWGTLVAPGAAADAIIRSAIDAFDRELKRAG